MRPEASHRTVQGLLIFAILACIAVALITKEPGVLLPALFLLPLFRLNKRGKAAGDGSE